MSVKIVFEERIVAFIDVLGFSSLVNNASSNPEKLKELNDIVSLLSDVIPILDQGVSKNVPAHLIPKHLYVSDCIILSAPLFSDDMPSYNGLEIIAMRISQLTHRFLDAGYLIRGGVSIGSVWHADNNIVGPAYQEAYKLEEKGCEPCVKLSPAAQETWEKHSAADNRMCLNVDNKFIVNGLHDAYMPRACEPAGISKTFEKYEKLISLNINNPKFDDRTKDKWEWFGKYLEQEKKLNG